MSLGVRNAACDAQSNPRCTSRSPAHSERPLVNANPLGSRGLEQNKRMNSLVDEANCWRISKVRRAEDFFCAIERLVPEATHMYVEGSPGPDVIAALQPHVEPKKYVAPAGTVWSWPRRNQRLTLRVSLALFDLLADLASHHAEPEICSHLHLYRG